MIGTFAGKRRAALVVMAVMFAATGLMAQKDKNKSSSSAPPPKSSSPAPASRSNGAAPAANSGPMAGGGANNGVARPANSGPMANGSHASPAAPRANGNSAGASAGHGTPQGTGSIPRAVPKGGQQTPLKNGNAIQRRPNGKVSDVHDASRNMDVHNGLNGSKRVSVQRPDHSQVVAQRGRPGYVQRSFSHNGHQYASRAYYYHGHEYTRYYSSYTYRGVYMNVYAPGYYYSPGFYGWAYNPWGVPIVYPWGFAGLAWYGYYGPYFAPYSAYPTASLWLTDYMISADVAADYQAQQDAGLPPPDVQGESPATADVKQMVADEVRRQLALENNEAQQNAQGQAADPAGSSIARDLTDGQPHTFVAGGDLDVVDTAGAECAISGGDVLELTSPPDPSSPSANLVVLASKGGKECPKADVVGVQLADLQEMQNHMRETIDQGLQQLQAKQGQGAIPAEPPSAQAAPVNVAFAQDAPPVDPNGAAVVNQAIADSGQAETQVIGQAQQETGQSYAAPAAAPVTIAIGQTIDDVTTNKGQPVTIIDLGAKKIYKYSDMKITFKSGKVSDVE